MKIKFNVEIIRHKPEGGLVKKPETVSGNIRLSEILDAYPGYRVSDISFFPECGFVNVYLKRESK